MEYVLHARSPCGGEKGFVDWMVWTGFLFDQGLVVKTLWVLCKGGQRSEECVRIIKSDRKSRELKRLGKMRKLDSEKERERLRVTGKCKNVATRSRLG